MKQEIYYGNVLTSNMAYPTSRPVSYVTNSTIAFTGFDLTSLTQFSKKLDLLFYNRVNEVGEVLSSLVYISGPIALGDVTEKIYNVTKLYVNTGSEIRMRITQATTDFTFLNCKWQTSKYFNYSISPLTDSQHEELATNGKPSIKLEQYGISFDGWYTQLSVGLRTSNTLTGTPTRNTLTIHAFSNIGNMPALLLDSNLNNTLDSSWSYLYKTPMLANSVINHDGTIETEGNSLASILTSTTVNNPYIKQELFILPTYIELYNKYVIQYAEYPTYGNPFPTLRDKHRIIHNFASENDFTEAQYILQTTEYFRSVIFN
jgi:hypothetical protein